MTAGTTVRPTNTTRQSLALQFDALRSQIDQVAQDSGFDGVNLLYGSTLNVIFNENGSSKLSMTGSTATASGLGLAASANQFQSDTDINTALTNVTTALNALQATTAGLGTYTTVMNSRVDFNKSMIDTLNSAADDLLATDTNEDGAALLVLQTRQQLAATALSLSHGQDTAVLRLFGL